MQRVVASAGQRRIGDKVVCKKRSPTAFNRDPGIINLFLRRIAAYLHSYRRMQMTYACRSYHGPATEIIFPRIMKRRGTEAIEPEQISLLSGSVCNRGHVAETVSKHSWRRHVSPGRRARRGRRPKGERERERKKLNLRDIRRDTCCQGEKRVRGMKWNFRLPDNFFARTSTLSLSGNSWGLIFCPIRD